MRGLNTGSSHAFVEEDPEVEELMRYFERPARFWKAVLAVPVLGLLALWVQPGGKGVNQLWSVTALLVWAVATVVVVGIVAPGLREMSTLLEVIRKGGPEFSSPAGSAWRARLARAGALASRGAAACDVLFFCALALMIWRP